MKTTHTFEWKGCQYTIYKRKRDASRLDAPWYFKLDNKPRSLDTTDTKQAVIFARARLDQRNKGGSAYQTFLDNTRARAAETVGKILEDYLLAKCPDRTLRPRADASLYAAKKQIAFLNRWWANRTPAHIVVADCDDYHQWRTKQAKKGAGHRMTDLELVTLSNALDWAKRQRRLEKNPLDGRPTYNRGSDVNHCRDFKPGSEDELHSIAAWLFTPVPEKPDKQSDEKKTAHQDKQPEVSKNKILQPGTPSAIVSGARVIFQAFTGLRCDEAVTLRRDAKMHALDHADPGHISTFAGQRILFVRRAKSGINPWLVVHDPLAQFIEAWLSYVARTWPESPWYFPMPNDPKRAQRDDGLRPHLCSAVAALKLNHRRPHGLRAYYVWVRRSQGISDAQIAAELGQATGPALITTTYGSPPPNWFGNQALGWMPKNVPAAWTLLPKDGKTNIIEIREANAPAKRHALDTVLDTPEKIRGTPSSAFVGNN